MTALWTPTTGNEPSATDLLTWRPRLVIKTVDESLSSSITLQNDDQLVLPVDANATYELWLRATQNSGATPGFRCGFTIPTGATWHWGFMDLGSSAANEQMLLTGSGGTAGITGAGADSAVIINAIVAIGSTAGNVQFQWAQSASNAATTTVRAGSSLLLRQVA